jgi:hypothetical protein
MDPDNLDMLRCLIINSDMWTSEDVEDIYVSQQ